MLYEETPFEYHLEEAIQTLNSVKAFRMNDW